MKELEFVRVVELVKAVIESLLFLLVSRYLICFQLVYIYIVIDISN